MNSAWYSELGAHLVILGIAAVGWVGDRIRHRRVDSARARRAAARAGRTA